ncbi:MAG TPA: HEAT repeat domain-containing protein [Vicinamibacterales bacterium]
MSVAFCMAALSAACATATTATSTSSPAPSVRPTPPEITWEDKLGWIIRLEDQRILRDPAPQLPVIIAPATATQPAVVAPPPPSDLIRLLGDEEGRVRRRAALAAGRVGLREGIEPLVGLLTDVEPEVRQMAAFALGLIGDRSARPALTSALKDADPMVQGRAAEALGNIGDRGDAPAVAGMTQAHLKAGAFNGISTDDLSHPITPVAEAARLGLYALARLNDFDAVAATALDASGRPVSNWWPVAYALQRPGDARATPALLTLLNTPGRFTAAFAARGLGVVKAHAAAAPLRQIVEQRRAHPAVVIQAVRALGAIGDPAAVPMLEKIAFDPKADPQLQLEALTVLSSLATVEKVDLLLDLLSHPTPPIRAFAMRALGRLDPETFLGALSGLDLDRDWTVRTAQAGALASIPAELSVPRLRLMLQDKDQRVIPAVLSALVAAKPPGVDRMLLDHLKADDFVIRAAAATALGELKATSALQALIAGYRGWEGDRTYVARAAALGAVARIDPAAARPVLEDALKDREWAIRVRAAMLLREQGVADADPMRPATSGRTVEPAEWDTLLNPKFSPHAFIETDKGTIEIELAILDAPLTVANFIELARKGFYNGIAVHRLVPDFVMQHGDPRGDGDGGPGYSIGDEINQRPYLRGTVGMALDWKDTGGSQYFITHSPQPHLDDRYTVFGHVVNGMEIVEQVNQGDVVRRIRIWDGITPQ